MRRDSHIEILCSSNHIHIVGVVAQQLDKIHYQLLKSWFFDVKRFFQESPNDRSAWKQ